MTEEITAGLRAGGPARFCSGELERQRRKALARRGELCEARNANWSGEGVGQALA